MGKIFKARVTTEYTQIHNSVLQSKELSLKAKGMLAYILSLPADWQVSKTKLHVHLMEGRDSCIGAFDELIKAGFVKISTYNDSNTGHIIYDYEVYPLPDNDRKPVTGNPVTENPLTDNTETLKRNTTKGNITKEITYSRPHLEKQLAEPIDHPDKVRFTDWWDAYQYQIVSEQRDCVMLWQRLTVEETKQIMAHTAKYCKAQEKRYRKRPFRYLNEREYLNEVPQPKQDKPAFTLTAQKTNH